MSARILSLTLACLTLAAPASAQTSPAWSTLAGISGEWSSAGGACDTPEQTWQIDSGQIVAGRTGFDLQGLGGGAGTLRADLVNRATGQRSAMSVRIAGDRLQISGAGYSVSLVRCDQLAALEAPDFGGDVIARPLDGADDIPSTSDLADALGGATGGGATNPDSTGPDDAELGYQALAGDWRGPAGQCDWSIGSTALVVSGTRYAVTNLVGTSARIGVNVLRDGDGQPATFTLSAAGDGATTIQGAVSGASGNVSDTAGTRLTRC